MELNEIAEAWLDTPNGRKWALARIKANLRSQSGLGTYDDAAIRRALPDLISPKLLSSALQGLTGVRTEPPSTLEVPLLEDPGAEPWRTQGIPIDRCADLLNMPRAELVAVWNELAIRSGIPDTLAGWDLLLVDIFRWMKETSHARPDRFVLGLMQSQPAGRNWAIVVKRGRAEILTAPLKIDLSRSARVRAFYDPIEQIEAIEQAIETRVAATEDDTISGQLGELPLGDKL